MNVRQLREGKNLSQQQLASMTGIPKDRIAKWEQGKGMPKASDAKTLEKFFKDNVPRDTKITETPQNGHQEKDSELKRLLKLIKHKTDKTIEEVAVDIGYARAYLTSEANKGNNPILIEVLKEKYKDFITDTLTTATTKPDFGLKPTNGHQSDKLLIIKDQAQAAVLYAEAAVKTADAFKNDTETIKKLVDLLTAKGKD